MTFPYPTFYRGVAVSAEEIWYSTSASTTAAATFQLGTPSSRRWVAVVQTSFSSSQSNPIPAAPTIAGISNTYTDGNSYTFSDDGEDSRFTLFHVPDGTSFQFATYALPGNRGGTNQVFLIHGPDRDTLTVTDEGRANPFITPSYSDHMMVLTMALNNTTGGLLPANFDVGTLGGGIETAPVAGASTAKLATVADYYSLKWS